MTDKYITPREAIDANPGLFRADFSEWVDTPEGRLIVAEFDAEARKIAAKRDHYSARTIYEYLRHNSFLRDAGPWKLNNNFCPDLARLFGLMNPRYSGLFELRYQDRRKERMGKAGKVLEARA